jgi:hypothetical protein
LSSLEEPLDDGRYATARLVYGIELGSSDVGWRFAGAGRWSTPRQLAGWITADLDDREFAGLLNGTLRKLNAASAVRVRAVNRPAAQYVLAAEVVTGRPGAAWRIDPQSLIATERRKRLPQILAVAARLLTQVGLEPTERPSWLLVADLLSRVQRERPQPWPPISPQEQE